jgi:hypothetical protein
LSEPEKLARQAAAEASDFNFTLAVGPLDDSDDAGRFDRVWLAQGVDHAKLSPAAQSRYEVARDAYVHLRTRLRKDRGKRMQLEHRQEAARAWAEAEADKGRSPWGASPPESVFVAAGVPTPQPKTRPVAHPRETGAGRPRRGDGTSRGGDSGDSSRPPDLRLARPGRASRRGGVR